MPRASKRLIGASETTHTSGGLSDKEKIGSSLHDLRNENGDKLIVSKTSRKSQITTYNCTDSNTTYEFKDFDDIAESFLGDPKFTDICINHGAMSNPIVRDALYAIANAKTGHGNAKHLYDTYFPDHRPISMEIDSIVTDGISGDTADGVSGGMYIQYPISNIDN